MKNSFPIYIVDDIQNLSAYLEEKFNYKKVFDTDWYIHLKSSDQELGLMVKNLDNQPDFFREKFNSKGVVLTIEVEDIDSYYKVFSEDEIKYKLTTEDWGQTHFIIQAPENIYIDVVKYQNPEEYKSD